MLAAPHARCDRRHEKFTPSPARPEGISRRPAFLRPALVGFLLQRAALPPSLFELLAPTLRLGASLVLLIPLAPIHLPIEPLLLPVSTVRHAALASLPHPERHARQQGRWQEQGAVQGRT